MTAGAVLAFLAITACGQTTAQPPTSTASIDPELLAAAETACLRYRGRAEADDDEFATFMAQSCTNVLADHYDEEVVDDTRAELAAIYLEALVALEEETSELMKRRRAAQIYPLRPNRIGEFLMAHHLGVIDSYGFWRHAYLRANPA